MTEHLSFFIPRKLKLERGADVAPVIASPLANLDLVERLKNGVLLNETVHSTFFDEDSKGYIKYPTRSNQ
ncbi:hypothetical protein [Viridibacillus arvi]|uniref:hypothetical protein n=1 Tax=Viridibacillus arvi TaxID=263475 RepID=UPI0036E94B3B